MKTIEDLHAMTAVFKDEVVELDATGLQKAQNQSKAIGQDALTINGIGESPLMYWVEWMAGVENLRSKEDPCDVGTCPGLMVGGIHGDDGTKVYKELCQAVEEWIDVYRQDKEPLPKAPALATTPPSRTATPATS